MPILGIDLGASSTVVATVGKGGVSIVRNDLAERLTPTLVSYTDKERLIGDSALSSLKSNAHRTCRYFRNVLGLSDGSVDRESLELEKSFALAPIVDVEGTPLAGFDVGREGGVTAVEVLGCFLRRIRRIAESYIGASCPDVVVTVPSCLTDAGRQAILDACDLVDLKCYRVMSQAVATALDYGLFRSASFKADEPQIVAFVDIGHSIASVFVAEFLPSQLKMLSVQESFRLGGRSLDRLIAVQLAEAFKQKYKLDVWKNAKAALKVEESAEKAKKVLSANKDTLIHLECLLEDQDLEATITREQFEELASLSYKRQLHDLIAKAIQDAKLTPQQIGSVEIIGGCTRIPFVQAIIEQVFQRPISKTLSADECVARGAAIQCAMLHPRHRVKDFQVIDIRSHPVYLTLPQDLLQLATHSKASNAKSEDKEHVITDGNRLQLFPASCPSYYVKWLVFPGSVATRESIEFSLDTVGESGVTVPLGEASVKIPSTIRKAAESCSSPEKMRLKLGFQSNINGIVQGRLVLVEEKIETETYTAVREVKNEAGEVIETKQVPESREKVVKHKTEFDVVFNRPRSGWLTRDQKEQLKAREEKWDRQDEATQRASAMANDILSKCFQARNELEDILLPYSNEQEREYLRQKTYEWEEWVECNPGLELEAYQPIWDEFQGCYNAIYQRKVQHDEEERRIAAEKAAAEEKKRREEEKRVEEAARKEEEQQQRKEEEENQSGETAESQQKNEPRIEEPSEEEGAEASA